MYIKSIELNNIRCFKQEKIELSKNINLLVGKNNSGKSTIIKSIYKLQDKNAISFDDIRKGEVSSAIYYKLDNLKSLIGKSIFPNNKTDNTNAFFSFENINTQNEGCCFDENLENIKNFNYRNLYGDLAFEQLPTFPTKENENNFIFPFLSKRKTDYYDFNGNKNDSFEVTDNFRNLASRIQRLGNPSHSLNNIFNELCDEILGFRIGTIPSENSNGISIGIFPTTKDIIYIQSMGEGVANIIGLITILLTENEKLFLIEELENDIHPEALKKLLNLIIEKSDKNQFIISTHSNIVLKYLGSAANSKIFYIDWQPKDIKSYSEKENIPISQVSLIDNSPAERINILQKLGYDFFDFELYKAYLILEESSAEQIIKEFIIPNFIPELQNKIKTIAAGGVDDILPRLIDFKRLFVFIHNSEIYFEKAWIIADGDEAGLKVIKDIRKQFSTWRKDQFSNWSKKNFEDYYPDRFQDDVKKIFELDKKRKRGEKARLLKEVLKWTVNEKDLAIKEFERSAKDVIDFLNLIAKKI